MTQNLYFSDGEKIEASKKVLRRKAELLQQLLTLTRLNC